MMKISCVKEVVATLEKLRDQHPSQFDTRDFENLEKAIGQLKELSEGGREEVSLGEVGLEALSVIATFVGLGMDLFQLFEYFRK